MFMFTLHIAKILAESGFLCITRYTQPSVLFSAASIKDGNTIKKSAKPKRSVPL